MLAQWNYLKPLIEKKTCERSVVCECSSSVCPFQKDIIFDMDISYAQSIQNDVLAWCLQISWWSWLFPSGVSINSTHLNQTLTLSRNRVSAYPNRVQMGSFVSSRLFVLISCLSSNLIKSQGFVYFMLVMVVGSGLVMPFGSSIHLGGQTKTKIPTRKNMGMVSRM